MLERKLTSVHRTLQMILCETLNPRMNIIETGAVLNIVQKDGKWAPEAKREGLKLIRWQSEHRVLADKFQSSGIRS